MVAPTLQVEKRDLIGRKVSRLRREGKLPANIYGKKIKSQAVVADLLTFQKILAQVGATGLVELTVKGETKPRPVLIHNVQLDPITDTSLHADFYQVDLSQKVTAEVPVIMVGEAPAVAQGGVLVQLLDEIEVEALPADLPDKLVVDVSKLEEIGQHLTVEDLQYDRAKVVLKLEDPKSLVVQIEQPAPEEEEQPTPAVVEEGAGAAEGAEEKPTSEAPAPEEKAGEDKKEKKETTGEGK